MGKRLFWLVVGVAAGVYLAVRVQRSLRRSVQRVAPERVTDDLIAALRDLRTDLRKAFSEGRDAMHLREAELRAELDGRLGGQP